MTARRVLTAAVASALLAGASPAAAQVTFVPDRGPRVTLTAEQVGAAQDVRDRAYTIRSQSGATTTATVRGASLRALLDAADVDRVAVGAVEIQRPGGASLLLSRNQALEPGAFPEGPPVFSLEGAGVSFLRPSTGPDDPNAGDRFSAASLTVRLRSGSLLEVAAEAVPERVDPREPVTFTATAEGSGAGERVVYSWLFDDGRRADGARVTHRFRKPGSYGVVVSVTAPGDRVGVSDVVRVQVGDPKAGEDRRGGGEDRSADAPDSGPGEGVGSGSARLADTDTPGEANGEADDQPPGAQDDARARSRDQRARGEGGERIEGELLADAAQLPATPAAAVRSARTGKQADEGFRVPATAWGSLATLLLIALGAALELRATPARDVAA